MRHVFFDLDHTLLKGNSANLFIRFQIKRGELGWTDLARGLYYTLLYRMNRIRIEDVTASFLGRYAGVPEEQVLGASQEWFDEFVRDAFYEEGIALVEEHRAQGDHLVLLTASTVYACMPIAAHLKLHHYLGTRLTLADGLLTGAIEPPLCYGAGKVEHARAYLREAAGEAADLRDAVFYTDSITDLPMLEAVGHPVAVNPDPLLAREARRRGWTIRRFRR